jgi:outer membrane murein-binding lipoprotein Lpp
MRRVLLALLLASPLATGCASPAEIRRGAIAHQQRAAYLEAHGDYYGAAREREKADKQFAKAQRRQYEQAYNRAYWY